MDNTNPDVLENEQDATMQEAAETSHTDDIDLEGLAETLEDAVPETALENGQYVFRVERKKLGQKAGNAPYLQVFLAAVEYPYSKLVSVFRTLPTAKYLDEREYNRAKVRMDEFLAAFGLTWDPTRPAPDELDGAECTAIVRKTVSGEYGEQNEVVKFI